jgi:hypothetical protein
VAEISPIALSFCITARPIEDIHLCHHPFGRGALSGVVLSCLFFWLPLEHCSDAVSPVVSCFSPEWSLAPDVFIWRRAFCIRRRPPSSSLRSGVMSCWFCRSICSLVMSCGDGEPGCYSSDLFLNLEVTAQAEAPVMVPLCFLFCCL